MKTRIDGVVICAALGIGYLMHVIITVDALILPAFLGAIALHLVAARVARPS